ncbi:hypothetical protein [Tropicimonas marinistellae]|uniref:hypothetical protein n=1 Tax=Tropicimonas marinistellae TaxID=1739787 RepID=UPI00082AB897|nr:hypothetical protein [Tropicimonas marinistellae]
MWVLRTVVLVPRPDILAAFPSLVVLFSYLALQGRDSVFLGHPLAPLTVAVAAGLVARQLRCTMFRPVRRTAGTPLQGAASGFGAVLLMFLAPSAAEVQAALLVLLLGWATTILLVIRIAPGHVARLPSVWAGHGKGSPDAMGIVAGSYMLRGVGAGLVMLSGNQTLWILFVSLGCLAIDFLTNWVILLYLYLRRVNGWGE